MNPGASRCSAETLGELAREKLGAGARVELLEPKEGLIDWIRETIRHCDPERVVVAGGDGTISAVVSALDPPARPVGVIPCGTANLLARGLDLPLEPEAALRIIARDRRRRVDAMRVDDRVSLCRISFGGISEIGDDATPDAKKRFAQLAYVWSAIPKLARSERRRFRVIVDGESRTTEATHVLLSNLGGLAASELRLDPGAMVDDGAVEVFMIMAEGVTEHLALLWDSLRHDDEVPRNVIRVRARHSVEVEAEADVPVRADGEALEPGPRTIEVMPGYLSMIC